MKRLTLQDLRTFVYKKGRLLYGAVFLFCLVLLYGLYRNYGVNIDNGIHGNSSTAVTTSENAFENNSSSDSKWSDDSVAPRGRQVYSLNKSLRPLPFDDPFFITLNGKDMVSHNTGDDTNGKSGKTVAGKSNNSYERRQQNNRHNTSNQYTVEGNGVSSDNSARRASGGSASSSPAAANNTITLMGIVQGNKTLAMIQADGEDGIYAVGEGNGHMYVKTIGSNSVVIVINGVEQRLYVK